MMRRLHKRAKRDGVTLLELLVVASIMLMLAAVSVPSIKPMMESRQNESAASVVSTYLNRARSRAMSTGRSCGVVFEKFLGSTWNLGTDDSPYFLGSACVVLRQVEVPPYYTGLDENTVVSVHSSKADGSSNDSYVTINGEDSDWLRAIDYSLDPYWTQFVSNEKNAQIQFDGSGPFYPIVNGCIQKLPGIDLPTRYNGPFKVKRDPRPTMTAPVGLPQGTVVDLEWSGLEEQNFSLGTDGDVNGKAIGGVTVMFSPSGEVDYIEDAAGRVVPTETLYFLVGKWDRITALSLNTDDDSGYFFDDYGEPITTTEDGLWNYEDPDSLWVTINPRTGLVTTVPLNPPLDYDTASGIDEMVWEKIVESREFARESKRNLGGR